MNPNLIEVCTKMLKEDSLSFTILEEKILLHGLQNFIDNEPELYKKHFNIINERNFYNKREIDQYLKSLNLIYELRQGFLDNMNNQNIIKVCFEDIQKNQIEIDRLRRLISDAPLLNNW